MTGTPVAPIFLHDALADHGVRLVEVPADEDFDILDRAAGVFHARRAPPLSRARRRLCPDSVRTSACGSDDRYVTHCRSSFSFGRGKPALLAVGYLELGRDDVVAFAVDVATFSVNILTRLPNQSGPGLESRVRRRWRGQKRHRQDRRWRRRRGPRGRGWPGGRRRRRRSRRLAEAPLLQGVGRSRSCRRRCGYRGTWRRTLCR